MRIPQGIQAALAAIALASCGGNSGYGGPTSPGGGSSSGTVGATITIRANGTVEPAEVNISLGQRVRFVNESGAQHQPTSNPHLSHTDCPAMNLPIMNNGQSMNTGAFEQTRVCGFHDHMNPDTEGLRGTIRVGGAGGPAGPVYVRP
jgi:plastocyanin